MANVITYRAKSSIRDVAKALGYASGQQDAWSKQADAWGGVAVTAAAAGSRSGRSPTDVLALAAELEHAPRHLGIHSGGMVICDRPIVEVCPVEWARLTGSTSKSKTLRGDEPIRTVLQWDKDDCAAIGLVKFDLLGLGMLEVLHGCIDLVREVHGDVDVDLATIPQEDEVYDMLCRADSVGVFQVESRAQMATLPRLRPREFYDLVVEVALIRPGPIQGGSVHPYIRRRNGQEEVTYLHPLLEPSLKKTLGVPLFQEQLMQMAIDVGGFSPGEADMLRQAMGSKRSHERMERLHQRFADGAAARDVPRRRHRDHLGEAGRLRQLRLPREPLGELRLPRVRVVVAEALVPGGVLRRPARRPADGLLRARTPSCRTPAATASRSAPPTSTRAPPPPRWNPTTLPAQPSRMTAAVAAGQDAWRWGKAEREAAPEDWGKPGPAVRLGISYVRGIGLRPGRGDRGRAALRRPGGPGPPGVAHAAAAGGAGHRRGLRLLRHAAAGGHLGRRRRRPDGHRPPRRPAAARHRHRGRARRRCRR